LALVPDSDSLDALRSTVGSALRSSFDDVNVDSDGDFIVRRPDAFAWVRLMGGSGDGGGALVVVWSVTNVRMRITGDLTRYLATEAANLTFGQFELDESGSATVHVSHGLIGQGRDPAQLGKELTVVVDAVLDASARYGPIIRDRFAGELGAGYAGTAAGGSATATPSSGASLLERLTGGGGHEKQLSPSGAGRRGRRWFGLSSRSSRQFGEARIKRIRAVFAAAGLVAGAGAAVLAYVITSSIALPFFVFWMTAYVIGRGAADVVTDPEKIRRTLFFLVMPAVASLVVFLVYWWWDLMWLAVILGFIPGIPLGVIAATLLFPGIAEEEQRDDEQRRRSLRD
jgi:hypothetical protein